MTTNPIITLTTDFGIGDPYVGQMKGAILSVAANATIIDLSHDVPAQDVLFGAIVLETVIGVFPKGAVHVAVVDPGVGSARRAVAIETEQCFFVGPDNGLFTAVLGRQAMRRAVSLTNEAYHRKPVSDTFHGRDIFAPVAGHLANGTAIDKLGDPVDDLFALDIPQPAPTSDGLELRVLMADHFGNLITNLRREDLGDTSFCDAVIDIGGQRIAGIKRTFADVAPGQCVAYFGSWGRLEIAVRDGNAAARLNAATGTACRIH